jgi:hypothetical protein
VRPEFLAESRKHKAAKLLRQIPCIGPIRAARLINRKIKNKICSADNLEGLGSGVTVWQMPHFLAAVVRP